VAIHESPLVARKENGIKLDVEVASKLTTSVGTRSVPEFQTFFEPFFAQVYNFFEEIFLEFNWGQVFPVRTAALEGANWNVVETTNRSSEKNVTNRNFTFSPY